MGRLLDIKRRVLKRGIQQCKVHRNTILTYLLSKGAVVNRIPKFKHREFFLSFFIFSRKLWELRGDRYTKKEAPGRQQSNSVKLTRIRYLIRKQWSIESAYLNIK
jgi:hypothetical protein